MKPRPSQHSRSGVVTSDSGEGLVLLVSHCLARSRTQRGAIPTAPPHRFSLAHTPPQSRSAALLQSSALTAEQVQGSWVLSTTGRPDARLLPTWLRTPALAVLLAFPCELVRLPLWPVSQRWNPRLSSKLFGRGPDLTVQILPSPTGQFQISPLIGRLVATGVE